MIFSIPLENYATKKGSEKLTKKEKHKHEFLMISSLKRRRYMACVRLRAFIVKICSISMRRFFICLSVARTYIYFG